MAHAIRAILLASAMAATLIGCRTSNAVSQGRCLLERIHITLQRFSRRAQIDLRVCIQ
jgi:predicted component of type VI protein secretion system